MEDGKTRSCDVKFRKGDLKDYKGKMPKKAPSVFNLFVKQFKLPDGAQAKDYLKLASEAFKSSFTEDDLRKFEEAHQSEVSRYEAQICEIETKGFYFMDDGKRSDQVTVLSRKKRVSQKTPSGDSAYEGTKKKLKTTA